MAHNSQSSNTTISAASAYGVKDNRKRSSLGCTIGASTVKKSAACFAMRDALKLHPNTAVKSTVSVRPKLWLLQTKAEILALNSLNHKFGFHSWVKSVCILPRYFTATN
jgi:hypothetical protein